MTLSIVVVSHGRPEALRRCLLGLSQQARSGAEVIVVADPAGLRSISDLPFADRIKTHPQPQPNISQARNFGISAAAGDIVAFIDDDAVPEPTWAGAVQQAFEDPELGAATGPVLGRNGISLQWGCLAVDSAGLDVPIDPNAHVRDGFTRKLQGTNMAFRRNVLVRHGGFDEAFRFYLDDTDLAFRLGQAGVISRWLPDTVVHHGFAASTRRTDARVPLTLHDIGASTAVYLAKHCDPARHADVLRDLEAAQSTRLLKLARRRKLDDAKMRSLMESLRDGIEDGRSRPSEPGVITAATAPFLPMIERDPPPPTILSGRPHQAFRLRRTAQDLVGHGQPVSLFLFEPTPRKHKVRFTEGGWWEQTGGLFGPADRNEPRLTLTGFRTRLAREIRRISATRGLSPDGDRN